MSKHESSDLGTPGYFLPEDSQFRLKKLRDYTEFLSRLAQPRTSDEANESTPDVRVGEIAICLELLSEQVELVLEELSWPAERKARVNAAKVEAEAADAEADAEAEEEDEEEEDEEDEEDEADAPEKMQEISVAVAERYSFGVTLRQIDALGLLVEKISANGDVVAGSHDAEFADHTLPLIGQAIYDGVEAVRAILGEVRAQRFKPRTPIDRVGETRAVYDVGFVGSAARSGLESGFGDGVSRTLQ